MTTRILNFSDGFSSVSPPVGSDLPSVSIRTLQTITESGTIEMFADNSQLFKLAGSGGPVICSLTPFDSNANNGALIILQGTSDTNTVEIKHNDAQYGCVLNGDAILGEYDKLTLTYDSSIERYVESSRNF